jgi:hypothetical protein
VDSKLLARLSADRGWSGGLAEWIDGDTAYLSVVFTWKLPEAYSRALFYRAEGYRVRVGGPGTFTRKNYFDSIAEVGGDIPDAIAHHNPFATIASRGCPVGCWFCIVPKMEGREFTLLPDFPVRPILCDNNLSALPEDYQRFIIGKYQAHDVPLMDANSGFEPRTFERDTFMRWDKILRGPWRFAFDEWAEADDVRRVMGILEEVTPKRKRVYVLIGNEPFVECMGRIKAVIQWGGEPHVQPYIKLNALTKSTKIRFDWTPRLIGDVARWANRRIWRYADFDQYMGPIRTRASDSRSGELWTANSLPV